MIGFHSLFTFFCLLQSVCQLSKVLVVLSLNMSLLNNNCSLCTAGLDTFITTAKKLPCPDLYDVVEGYIKISMECSEIFKLLEGDKQTESEVCRVQH